METETFEREKRKPSRLWQWLCSTRLTIVLLIAIALASTLGTFIPQNAEEEVYLAQYGRGLHKLLQFTGITDLYHSWWFVALLSLLCLNVLICTLERFSLRLKSLGSFLTHISILGILAGAIVGGIWGERGLMGIYEGQTTDVFYRGNQRLRLGFSLNLEDFTIEHYDTPQSDTLAEKLVARIKDYKSKLKVIENERVVAAKTVEVNDPLRYKGYTFYQYDYDHTNLSYTVLQVVKDPGVPIVYAGFVLLLLGLTFTYAVKPLAKKGSWSEPDVPDKSASSKGGQR